MELRFVVPNMEKTFGNLEFAGENTTEQQRINGRMAVITRSYNLYCQSWRKTFLAGAESKTYQSTNHYRWL